MPGVNSGLFNIVLSTGYVPTEWCLGIICPIYKNNGSIDEPDNYRGITILSCTCKLFIAGFNSTDYLCMLMTIYWVGNMRVSEKGTDHACVLHLVIELYQSV